MQALQRQGYIGEDSEEYGPLHGYHCGCGHCELDGPYPLRAQRDSSCSGEVISSPFWFMAGEALNADYLNNQETHWGELISDLCKAAVEVDAVPGLTSGFHVHVQRPSSWQQQARQLWAFYLWEPFLTWVAAGRWTAQRSMNRKVRDDLQHALYDAHGRNLLAHYVNPADITRDITGETASQFFRSVLQTHGRNDRHSNLNLNTGHGTHEFRLWNSTRSAWRMELFIALSVAMSDPTFITNMLDLAHGHELSEEPDVDLLFMFGLDHAGHDRAAELLQRQVAYLRERAPSAPSELLAL